MENSITQISELLDSLFAYGPWLVYLIIFVACFIENIFPPFPGDTFIAVAGGLVALDRLDLYLSFAAVIGGGLCSVMLLFYFGRHYGRSFFVKKNYKYFSAKDIDIMETRFSRYGVMILIASRFIVGLRTALAVAAGVSRFSALGMFLFSFISYVFFAGTIMYIAIVLVENFDQVRGYFAAYNYVIWPLIIIGITIVVVRKVKTVRKNQG